jgi:hypothetical protein
MRSACDTWTTATATATALAHATSPAGVCVALGACTPGDAGEVARRAR